MKPRKIIFLVRILAVFVMGVQAGGAQPGQARGTMKFEAITTDKPSASPEIEALVDRLFPEGEAEVEQLKQTPVEFPGSADRPEVFAVLVATKRSNPMLTENCRREAAIQAADHLAEVKEFSRGEAAALANAHLDAMQGMVRKMGGISYADYLKHMVECKGFCRPIIAHMLHCHVLAVSNHEHGIVLFDTNSDYVKPEFRDGVIQDVVVRLADGSKSKQVLLIGRASRTGALKYNRRLSGRRALAVKDVLMERGAEPSRVKLIWLGWEQPQINEWIAKEYDMEREYELGERAINQSVMMVLY